VQTFSGRHPNVDEDGMVEMSTDAGCRILYGLTTSRNGVSTTASRLPGIPTLGILFEF
jgi:hypothetical protein